VTSETLSDNEKAVLLSIMCNPEHSDKGRSASLNMNIFTFNKIKNKLIREKYMKREFVPNYGLLGFEIFLASFGSRMEPFISEEMKETLATSIIDQVPSHLVIFLAEPGQGMGFHVIEDFTSMKNGLVRAERKIFDTLGMERSGMSIIPFSLKDIKVHKMFDLNNLMSSTWKLNIDVPNLAPTTIGQEVASISWDEFFKEGSQGATLELNEDEWNLLIQLVSNPDDSDQTHLDKAGMSRYKYRRIRKLLFEKRALKPLIIPDPVKIGFEVLIFTHMKFKPSIDAFEMFESGNWVMPENLVMAIFDRQDAVGIGLYPNLSEGSKAHNDLLNMAGKMNMLDGIPHVQIFSLAGSSQNWPLTFSKPLIQKGDWEIPDEMLNWLKELSSSVQGSQLDKKRSP
jgi:hypothetical protein